MLHTLHGSSSRQCCCGAALSKSELVPRLLSLAERGIAGLSASDMVFLLDGCARLAMCPPTPFIEAISEQARHLHTSACEQYCAMERMSHMHLAESYIMV